LMNIVAASVDLVHQSDNVIGLAKPIVAGNKLNLTP